MSELQVRGGEDAYAPIASGARLPRLWVLPFVLLLLVATTVAVLVVGGIVAGLAGGMEISDPTPGWKLMAVLVTGGLSALAVITILWITYFERRSLATVGFTRFRLKEDLLWFVGGLVFALVVALAIGYGAGDASELDALPGKAAADPGRLLAGAAVLALILLPNSVVEELLFRGWALSVIGRRAGLWPAAIVTSLVFGAAHVPPTQWADPARLLSFVSYALAGLAFAGLALWRRSLWAPIAFHTGFNTLLVTAAYADAGLDPARLLEQITASPLGTESVPEAVVWLVVEAAFAALMIHLWRRSRRPSPA